jgi:plastocyanin
VNPPPSAQAPAPQPKPRDVSVTIQNFAFSPATLRISKGTTVTWTNGDAAPHRIDANGAFPGSPSLATGQSYSYTFDEVGTFSYICSIHPSMKGTVEVVP